jgi:RimJ/RimL family protein N-acetyltransferase
VTLRRPSERDVPEIVEALRDPETVRWTSVRTPYDEADAVALLDAVAFRWASGAGATWGTYGVAAPGARWSGSVNLRVEESDAGSGRVGFHCAPWARGRGFGTAAVLVCAWGFEVLALERIEWQAQVGNDPSRRVVEKVGFVFEGTQRSRLVQRGERRDCWVAGLLPGDLR